MYNESMAKAVPNAFTLVELLVAIAVMAIISVITLSSYRSFGRDQNLNNAALDIQNQLRSAQANATANAQCASDEYGTTWQVYFTSDRITTNLNCQFLPSPLPVPSPVLTTKKTFQLGTDITIQSVSGTGGSNCPSDVPFTISFDPLTGKTKLQDSKCTGLKITLTNTKTTKSLIIEQGGNIYVQ